MNLYRHSRSVATAIALIAVSGGCSKQTEPNPQPSDVVSGNVIYPEIPLGDSSTLEVQLKDVSEPNPGAALVGVQRIRHPGRSPVHFTLSYPRDRIDPEHHYVVDARIFDPDQLLFATDTPVAVITHGNPNIQDVKLLGVQHSSGVAPQEAVVTVNGKARVAGIPSDYSAQFAGEQLIKIDEVRAANDGKVNASYSFEGARLMTATEESSQAGARSALTVSFDDRGHVDAIAQSVNGKPVKPEETAAAKVRNRGSTLRSYVLAQRASQSHNMAR